jgi:hypothetical protein
MFSQEGQRKCNFSKSFRGAGCTARVPDAGYAAAPRGEVELPAVGKYAELGFTIAVTNAADATPGDRVSSSQEKSFKFNRFVAKRIPLNTQVPDEFLSPGW